MRNSTTACEFVETRGGTAAIGKLQDAAAIISGENGTRIEPGNGVLRDFLPRPVGLLPHNAG